MRRWLEQFADVARTWRPEPVVMTDVVRPEAPTMFTALLDQPSPVTSSGDRLPPLWHWFLHHPIHPQQTLGTDGHPKGGPLLPPLPEQRRRMAGGGRISVRAPLRCGDEVRRTDRVTAVRAAEGSSGPLLLVTTQSTLEVDTEVRVVEEQDIVYLPPRRTALPDSGSQPGSPGDTSGAPADAAWTLEFVPDPVVLFRFSALTTNAHRIHYDRDFARENEGHPDLVVHGPLSALLLLELPRRYAPDRTVTRFSWRARQPAYVGQLLRGTGRPGGDEIELELAADSTPRAVVGTAVLAGAHDRTTT